MQGNYLEIGGVFFVIEGELDLEFYSPFIDAEEIVIQGESINPRGNYVMPMELIGTPELAKALQNPQLLQVRNRVSVFSDVVLWSGGRRLDHGSFELQTIPHNLNSQYWKVSGWKIIYKLPLTWEDIRNHNWAGSHIIRSGKYYISSIKFKMPSLLRKVQAIVETFEL